MGSVAGSGGDEIQAAQAASGSASTARPAGSSATSSAHVAFTTTDAAPAAASGQLPARRATEADDGKARFVCCSFGGRKAGRKQRK